MKNLAVHSYMFLLLSRSASSHFASGRALAEREALALVDAVVGVLVVQLDARELDALPVDQIGNDLHRERRGVLAEKQRRPVKRLLAAVGDVPSLKVVIAGR